MLRGDRTVWALAAIAAVVFLPGLGWGLPHATSAATIRGWDVDAVTGVSTLAELHNLLVSRASDWYVAYPLLHYLLLAAVYAPYLGWLVVSGQLHAPTAGFPYGLSDPVRAIATLSVLGRLLTVAMAVTTEIGRASCRES